MNYKSATLLLLAVLSVVLTGCVSNRTLELSKSFAVPDNAAVSGPPVAIYPVQEVVQDSPAYSQNASYLGSGMGMIFLITILPIAEKGTEFYADAPRVDVIRTAAIHQLVGQGIPVMDMGRQGSSRFQSMPAGSLGLEIRLRKIEADTNLDFFFTLLIDTVISYNDITTRVGIDCILHEAGNDTPLWTGSIDESYGDDVPPATAIAKTVDQCVARSNLVEQWKSFSSREYAELITRADTQVAAGDISGAIDSYGKASQMSISAESNRAAFAMMANRYQKLTEPLAVPEDARKYSVQAVAEVQNKHFAEAASLYAQANTIAPWWPAGHYNRGLILAEIKRNSEAADELQKYLLLAPNAANAREVQDEIYVLESRN